ncbi:MAG: VOC family protein [Beijerinckiaceae bacterium]
MPVQGLHHVAYRCKDAKETVDFYTRYLKLPFRMALAENLVPSTREWSPHIHIFFQMEDGSFVAFFELPEAPAMELDTNTPDWVQHLAMRVPDVETLEGYKKSLEEGGVKVVGPTNHGFCRSIYFFDPNGHRLELTVDTSTPDMIARLLDEAQPTLEHWNVHKTAAAKDLDWVHANVDQ